MTAINLAEVLEALKRGMAAKGPVTVVDVDRAVQAMARLLGDLREAMMGTGIPVLVVPRRTATGTVVEADRAVMATADPATAADMGRLGTDHPGMVLPDMGVVTASRFYIEM